MIGTKLKTNTVQLNYEDLLTYELRVRMIGPDG